MVLIMGGLLEENVEIYRPVPTAHSAISDKLPPPAAEPQKSGDECFPGRWAFSYRSRCVIRLPLTAQGEKIDRGVDGIPLLAGTPTALQQFFATFPGMTLPQVLAFSIIFVMMALFAWGRWRYDLVAAIALLAAVIVGIVPPDRAFTGFSDDIVIIVGSALVVSAAVARSGVIERIARWLGPHLVDVNRQILALVGSVMVLSAFVKNVGALAMVMPIAFELARRTGTSPSSLLMPMSFGALLGGIVTLVGTSPNIIVSRLREQLLGAPFNMFDFTPVGIGIALAGFAFLVFGWRLLPLLTALGNLIPSLPEEACDPAASSAN
jgi:hypothetical protein